MSVWARHAPLYLLGSFVIGVAGGACVRHGLMTIVEAVGYTAFIANVAGNLMLAKQNLWGWVVRLVTNVLWIGYAVNIEGGGPMWLNHVAFFAINVYGFTEWKRKEQASGQEGQA